MEIGVIEINEVHDDVVEGNQSCEYSENKAEDKSIMIQTFYAIFIAGYYAVFWVDSFNDLCHDLKLRHSDY